jgi:hypothetical protein
MASLYKRATPSQRRILRAVEGVVKNVADHHSDFAYTPRLARSIAKRAAGTLTAQWPDVLAAALLPSDQADVKPVSSRRPLTAHTRKQSERGASQVIRRSPLVRLWKEISSMVNPAKKAGQVERAETLIEVLRLIATKQSELQIPTKGQ